MIAIPRFERAVFEQGREEAGLSRRGKGHQERQQGIGPPPAGRGRREQLGQYGDQEGSPPLNMYRVGPSQPFEILR